MSLEKVMVCAAASLKDCTSPLKQSYLFFLNLITLLCYVWHKSFLSYCARISIFHTAKFFPSSYNKNNGLNGGQGQPESIVFDEIGTKNGDFHSHVSLYLPENGITINGTPYRNYKLMIQIVIFIHLLETSLPWMSEH